MTEPIAGAPWFLMYGLPFMSGLFGSAVGAVVTWLTAGRKLARERVFDRQLVWHETMHRQLAAAVIAINDALGKQKGPYDPYVLASALRQALDSLREYRADAFLFASADVVLLLNSMWRDREESMRTFEGKLEKPLGDLRENNAVGLQLCRQAEAFLNMLTDAMAAVSASHRNHLGLPILPDNAHPGHRAVFGRDE
ncbi:MAG: hypothetical protein JWM95_1410 [Gemmatimonadetes bacterium]|nr:hypothetical protein [Gemmatimonadota bacterium]